MPSSNEQLEFEKTEQPIQPEIPESIELQSPIQQMESDRLAGFWILIYFSI